MSVKISELPILDSLADNDVIAGVDTSANVTSKIEMATLKNYIDTNTQYTAGTNIDITNNVVSAPNVYNKTETDGLIDDLETNINEQLEEKDEQIEELQSEVDSLSTIYNAFPTESGEGESLTLDDTAEVKFKKFDLKGNTSQTTYSGKNLLPEDKYDTTRTVNGITYTNNGNGTISVSGTSTKDTSIDFIPAGNFNLEANQSYYFYSSQPYNGNTFNLSIITVESGATRFLQANSTKTREIASTSARVTLWVPNGATVNAQNVKLMLVKGTTAPTEYEPYVGGTPSPNPSYPQPVNVVSGDNSVEICGKNLLGSTLEQMKEYNTSGTWSNNKFTRNGVDITPVFVNGVLDRIELNGTCTGNFTFIIARYTRSEFLSKITVGNSYTLSGCPSEGTSTSYYLRIHMTPWINFMTDIGNSFTITMPSISEDTQHILMVIGIDSGTNVNGKVFKPMFRLSSTSNTYEPYQANTYDIDLPVENLLNLPNNTKTSNGITSTITNGKLKIVGTTTANWFSICDLNVPLESGTYTFSYTNKKVFRYNLSLRYEDNTTGTIYGNTDRNTPITLSQKATITAMSSDSNTVGATFDYEDYLMIEKGSKQNNFTPYGTTPIELCKIGNYQDYFVKSDGRNLFDKDNANYVNGWIDGTTMRLNTINGNRMFYIPCKPNTTYTISRSVITSSFRTTTYDSTPFPTVTSSNVDYTVGSVLKNDNGKTLTITTNANAKYLVVHYGKIEDTNLTETLESIMIEKGSSASDYQPYGVGKWYLHKEIGKVVLNGSENWQSVSSVVSGTSRFYYDDDNILNPAYINAPLSNMFKSLRWVDIYNQDTTTRNGVACWDDASHQGRLLIRIDNAFADSVSAFKTWLGTNLPIVYHVLATPTTTEITYQPLIDQLNELEKAMSKDGQTNISQVNNDKPFILDVTAIKSLQSVLDRIELLES